MRDGGRAGGQQRRTTAKAVFQHSVMLCLHEWQNTRYSVLLCLHEWQNTRYAAAQGNAATTSCSPVMLQRSPMLPLAWWRAFEQGHLQVGEDLLEDAVGHGVQRALVARAAQRSEETTTGSAAPTNTKAAADPPNTELIISAP